MLVRKHIKIYRFTVFGVLRFISISCKCLFQCS